MDGVAGAGVHDKVDHTTKNARQFHDHAVAQAGIATRDKQGAVDGHGDIPRDPLGNAREV